jgi:paraquat-inducible protein B
VSEESVVVETVARRFSAIWIVPVIAVVLGIWLAVNAYLEQGPTVTIRFENAEAIQVDKTLVKIRNVTVGTVTGIRLAGDLGGVVVTAELDPETVPLLREDTQFWVMKAEVRAGSVSGLGTLLSGAYLDRPPGIGEATGVREFVGLDLRPISPAGTPGMSLQLTSESSGSVGVGSPILFKGYQVGTVERVQLDVESRQLLYAIFIDAPYHGLVSSSTRFWNASGISAELSTEGVKLSIGSLQSALVGGVSFDLPRSSVPGEPVVSDQVFRLYPNEASIHQDPFRFAKEYVVSFEQSLRGLLPGAPVTYRGIRIGSVIRIMLDDLNANSTGEEAGRPIPVLIKLEPGRLELGDTEQGVTLTQQSLEIAVESGLRATLESGNLLTGARLIDLDFYDVDERESLGEFIGYPTIPSISGGLAHIQVQISQVLDKLNQLPLEGVLSSAQDSLVELEGTLTAVRRLAESDGLQQLPMSLQATLNQVNQVLEGFSADSEFQSELTRALEELKGTLQSINKVADQIDEKSNSLVFPLKQMPDPHPEVSR